MRELTMLDKGRGRGRVAVRHAREGVATVVDFQAATFGRAFVFGAIDTADRAERGDLLLRQRSNDGRVRAIVPKKYTHLQVERADGSVMLRWRIGFGTAEDCQILSEAEGDHPDVLAHRGGPATAAFTLDGRHDARIVHFSWKGGQRKELRYVTTGPFRGEVRLPGPGLIQVDALAPWTLRL
ncbi:hypothetical protein [Nocardia sp. NPDC051832]|uniref:hypothetical protein n=1 Tax=Nocardia sp. NPDC051832 TaxID=3155673 RepID=UPI0034174E18